jgi:AsmA protein
VRQDTPTLGMDEKLSGVEAGPLLKDFMGKDYVTGRANLAAKMSARGIEPEAVKKSLNGSGNFSFENGQVKGINIGYLIRKAYALYKQQPVPDEEVEQTDFTALGGSFTAKDGVITTRDLSARSPLFQIAGKGSADLVKEKLDVRLDTTVVSSLKNAAKQSIDELKGVTIPVTIKGRFSDPKIGVDVASVLEARLKAEVEKKKKEAEAKAKARVEQEKKKLEEEKKKLEKELENKLEDKLKNMLKF